MINGCVEVDRKSKASFRSFGHLVYMAFGELEKFVMNQKENEAH